VLAVPSKKKLALVVPSKFCDFLCQKNKYSFKMLENAKNSKRSKFVRELRLAMEDQTARGGGGKVDPCTWTSGIDS
jgi:hypothetical protein